MLEGNISGECNIISHVIRIFSVFHFPERDGEINIFTERIDAVDGFPEGCSAIRSFDHVAVVFAGKVEACLVTAIINFVYVSVDCDRFLKSVHLQRHFYGIAGGRDQVINRSFSGINDRIVVVVVRVIADFPVPAEFAHGTGLFIAVQVGNGNDHIAEGCAVVDAVIGITRIPQCDRCTDHSFNILIAFRDDIGQRIHIEGRGIAFAVGHGNAVEGHTADSAAGCGVRARCSRTLEREGGIAYGIVRLLQFCVGGRERIADRGRGQDPGSAGERQIVIGPGKDDLHLFRAVKIIGHGSGGGIDRTGPADCAMEGEIVGSAERRIGSEVAIDHDRTRKRLGAFTGQGQVAVSTGKDFLCAVAIVAHIAPGGTVEGAGEGAGEGDRAVVGEGSGSEVAIHIKGCRFIDGGGIGSDRTGSSCSAIGCDHQIRVCPSADLLISIAVICHFPVVFSSGSKIAADCDPADVCQGCSGNISCNDQCAADRICDPVIILRRADGCRSGNRQITLLSRITVCCDLQSHTITDDEMFCRDIAVGGQFSSCLCNKSTAISGTGYRRTIEPRHPAPALITDQVCGINRQRFVSTGNDIRVGNINLDKA